MNTSTEQGMQDAVKWTNNCMGLLRVGGVWTVPRSGMIIEKIDHRVCRITEGESPDEIIKQVLLKGGWTIQTGET